MGIYDDAAYNAAHDAGMSLAYVISRFEEQGFLTLPDILHEDLEAFRVARAAWVAELEKRPSATD